MPSSILSGDALQMEGPWQGVRLRPTAAPAPHPGNGAGGSSGSLALRLTSEAPARENGPTAIHAPRSNTSAQHQTGRGHCDKPAGWQGKHRHSWAEGGGVRCLPMGFSSQPGGSAPIHGAQHPAVGLDTQLWCSSPGHGAQHPAVWFSTWMQGPAPNCGARHPALGFGTQLWGSAHPCRVQHPAAGLSTQPLALLEQPKGNLVVMETHWQGRISVHLGARSSLDKGSRNKR